MSYAKIPSIRNNKEKKENLEKRLKKHGEMVEELRNDPHFKAAVRKIYDKILEENPDASIEDLTTASKEKMLRMIKEAQQTDSPEKLKRVK